MSRGGRANVFAISIGREPAETLWIDDDDDLVLAKDKKMARRLILRVLDIGRS